MSGGALALRVPLLARVRDFTDLGKPRLSSLVVFTSAVGVWLAPVTPGRVVTVWFLLATTCLVGAANALNCWIEREIDARMLRTRNRPLPAGRMDPRFALAAGCAAALASLVVLAVMVNPLTASLGAVALATYVLAYTPLKRISPWALVVGAVPGALPPLMGWTAATGELALGGWVLFAILFAWQLPHFTAIALYLKEDFRRAGFRVVPLVSGDAVARRHLFAYVVLLVATSLAAQPLGLAGPVYTAVAALLGVVFLALAADGLRREPRTGWAPRTFGYTLVYLPVLISVLVLNAR